MLVKSEIDQSISEWWLSRRMHHERGSEYQLAVGLVDISGPDPVRLLDVFVRCFPEAMKKFEVRVRLQETWREGVPNEHQA